MGLSPPTLSLAELASGEGRSSSRATRGQYLSHWLSRSPGAAAAGGDARCRPSVFELPLPLLCCDAVEGLLLW